MFLEFNNRPFQEPRHWPSWAGDSVGTQQVHFWAPCKGRRGLAVSSASLCLPLSPWSSVLLPVRKCWQRWPWMGKGTPLFFKLIPWALFYLKTRKLPADSYQIQSGANSTGKKIWAVIKKAIPPDTHTHFPPHKINILAPHSVKIIKRLQQYFHAQGKNSITKVDKVGPWKLQQGILETVGETELWM